MAAGGFATAQYTFDQIAQIFKWYNVDASVGAQPGETSNQRILRIVNDLNTGQRTWAQVARSVSILPGANGNPAAPDPGPDPLGSYKNPPAGTPSGKPPTPGGGSKGDPNEPPPSNALDVLEATYPWLKQLGIPISQFQDWITQGITGEALVNKVRETPQWAAMFPGIRRDDGTLRMQEAQYLTQQDSYRELYHQYVDPAHDLTASEMAGWFVNEVDPNELKQRFDVYDTVKRGGQDVKDAFYVYAGMRPTDDQLYKATTDPTYGQQLVNEYNQRVTAQPLDYGTWITRATEAGLGRVASTLQSLQQQGVTGENAMSQLQQADPNFARQMMDVLYHGGDPAGGQTLNLQELMHSFEYAMIGSAATQSGLALPDKARVEALREAGVDRAKALQAYSDYSSQQNLLSGMAQRAGQSGFTQDDFEKAVLLHVGPAEGALNQIQAQEKGLSHATGGADVQMDEYGRQVQRGLRPAFQ